MVPALQRESSRLSAALLNSTLPKAVDEFRYRARPMQDFQRFRSEQPEPLGTIRVGIANHNKGARGLGGGQCPPYWFIYR